MNYNFASIEGLGPGSLPYLRKIHKAQRAENFSNNKQNSSRISSRLISDSYEHCRKAEGHLTSRIYPSLHKPYTLLRRAGSVLRRFTPKIMIARQYGERFGNPRRRTSAGETDTKCSLAHLYC